MSGKIPTVKRSVATDIAEIYGEIEHYTASTAADTALGNSQSDTDTPTLSITLSSKISDRWPIERFLLLAVKHYMDVDGGADTYRLTMQEKASANDIETLSDEIFDSHAGMAEATHYYQGVGGKGARGAITTVNLQLPKIVHCAELNKVYYKNTWASGSPSSSVTGYIKVYGRHLL